jgi:uncharacterized membrane protein
MEAVVGLLVLLINAVKYLGLGLWPVALLLGLAACAVVAGMVRNRPRE